MNFVTCISHFLVLIAAMETGRSISYHNVLTVPVLQFINATDIAYMHYIIYCVITGSEIMH